MTLYYIIWYSCFVYSWMIYVTWNSTTKLKLLYTLMITALLCKGSNSLNSHKSLQKEYGLMRKWFEINNMEINARNTNVMVFGTKRKISNQLLKISHGNEYLDNVTDITYLGVTLDQSLNWTLHVSNTTKKINKAIACIRRIKSYLNQRILVSFIIPSSSLI